MTNIKEWYEKPKPDSRSSLFNFLTKDEKEALKKIKRQIRTFERMNTKEYEKLQSEYAECIFCLIESFVKEEDKEQIKAKVQEYVSEYILDFNNVKALSIALRILTEYLQVNENQDDERTYRLAEELSELKREMSMFYELLGLFRR